jgi:hypothetical protein
VGRGHQGRGQDLGNWVTKTMAMWGEVIKAEGITLD